MWWLVVALTLTIALCAPARAAEALDCPGRPWPKVGTIEVTKTTKDNKPEVTKIGYFAAENAITASEVFRVWYHASGHPGERWFGSHYMTMGRLSCLYDYTYEWMARRGKAFRVVGHFTQAARSRPGHVFSWSINCFVETRACHFQPHTGNFYDADAFLLILFDDKHPAGDVCVRGAPAGTPTVSLRADGKEIARVGPAPGRIAEAKYVCLDAASGPALAALKGARRVDYEGLHIEPTALTEAMDFSRLLRERVVMAEGRHEKEQRMRADADARLKSVEE